MIQMVDLDETSPFIQQLQSEGNSPVTIINTFIAPEGQIHEVIAAWKKDSDAMKASKGFISAQLYGAHPQGQVLTNIAVWETARDLLNAFMSPAFQALLAEYPDGTVAHPVLMRKVAVENVCVAA